MAQLRVVLLKILSFQSLNLEQTEELHDDIERYLSLEQSEVNIDFWTVCSFAAFESYELIPVTEHDGSLQRQPGQASSGSC